MAKVGETDPRWIVAERADGTNVNNWHWCVHSRKFDPNFTICSSRRVGLIAA